MIGAIQAMSPEGCINSYVLQTLGVKCGRDYAALPGGVGDRTGARSE